MMTIERSPEDVKQTQDFLERMVEKLERSSDKIEQAARAAHEANRVYCQSIGDDSQVPWDEAPAWQKGSARAGIRNVIVNPDVTPEQSHEKWMEQKLSEGWVYGPEKDTDKKQHPCIVSYENLPEAQRVKDRMFLAVARAVLGQ